MRHKAVDRAKRSRLLADLADLRIRDAIGADLLAAMSGQAGAIGARERVRYMERAAAREAKRYLAAEAADLSVQSYLNRRGF